MLDDYEGRPAIKSSQITAADKSRVPFRRRWLGAVIIVDAVL